MACSQTLTDPGNEESGGGLTGPINTNTGQLLHDMNRGNIGKYSMSIGSSTQ